MLLFVLALAVGWWLGRRSLRPGSWPASADEALRERVRNMHNLLDRHSDDALERLSQGLSLNEETLESHVHVGNLFRRRGDIEKAIQIHQELLEKASANPELSAQISLELARDYIAGGLLGSAEQLLDELMQRDGQAISLEALDELRRIAEREKDWARAVELAARLVGRRPQLKTVLANYYCEQAQERIRAGDRDGARELLKEARRVDPQCVRALLMRLDCELWQRNFQAADASITELCAADAGFLGELLPMLRRRECCAEPEILACLRRLAEVPDASPALLAILAQLDADGQGWRGRLLAKVQQQPSWRGLLDMLGTLGGGRADQELFTHMQPIILGLYRSMPHYRCGNCGFAGRELHWQCPGCHGWNTLRPIAAPQQ